MEYRKMEFMEQSAQFSVGINDGKIVLLFPTDISKLSLDADQAKVLVNKLTHLIFRGLTETVVDVSSSE